MNKTLAFVLFFLFLPGIFSLMVSCGNKCYDQCYTVTNIELKAVDNGDSIPKPPVNSTIKAKALLLQLWVKDTVTDGMCTHKSAFTNDAFATYFRNCSTTGPYIQKLTITADKNFDSTHPAGTDLYNLFFEEKKVPYYTAGIYNFYLLNAPDKNDSFVFTINIKLDNGKVLTASTLSLNLLK